MTNCGPACTVRSCASSPVVGFGSAGSYSLGNGGLGYGYGGLGYRGLGYGYGAGDLAETSGTLGTLGRVFPSCSNQIPPAELVFKPAPIVVTIPGPILSPSCEPVTVGGNTPCTINGSGIVASRVAGFGSALNGLGYGLGGIGYGYGLGGLGSGSGLGGLGYGGLGSGYGAVQTSGNLGTMAGVIPSPFIQLNPAEVVFQQPPFLVTNPGPILSASCEPVSVGGITPCAIGGSGIVGSGLYGGLGYGYGALGRRSGYFGKRSLLGRRGSVCGNVCK
ncbi:shematrin-like protein 2 [Hemicordylus capensis]|uniref:shematrin-like protein 2 n=1 Tax=Hemicordylus capensis TaxID=884348 RepID=UPI00230428A3|nr:shematrin-like protein 2 [Hemicordylus capensis]